MLDRQTPEQRGAHRSGYRVAGLAGRLLAGRLLAGRLLAGLGWLILALGPVGGAVAYWLTREIEPIIAAAAAGLSGLLMVVAGQVTRATVDNAERTREILALLQSGPLSWATRPPAPAQPAPPSPRSPEQAAWLKSPSTPISAEMRDTVASEHVRPCVNPFCGRLLPEDSETCPHCRTRQRAHSPGAH